MDSENRKRQKISEGYGAVYHRVYSINLPLDLETAKKAMLDLQCDLNKFSPQLLARFEKIRGHKTSLMKDDEFNIHITGPWNGPVRVSEVSASGFGLLTLNGHLEAGEINFRIKFVNDVEILFEIESLARSRDAIVDFVYDKVPLAKMAQTEMWSEFCKNFADHVVKVYACKGKEVGELQILTERQDEESKKWEKL